MKLNLVITLTLLLGSVNANFQPFGGAQAGYSAVLLPIPSINTLNKTAYNSTLWNGHLFSDYLDQAVKTTSNVSFTNVSLSQPIYGLVSNATYAGYCGVASSALSAPLNNSDQWVNTTSSVTFAGVSVATANFTGGNLALPNNKAIKINNVAGSGINALTIDTLNNLYAVAGGTIGGKNGTANLCSNGGTTCAMVDYDGNFVINNAKGYRIKDSVGTSVNIMTLTAANVLQFITGTSGSIGFYNDGGNDGSALYIKDMNPGAYVAIGTGNTNPQYPLQVFTNTSAANGSVSIWAAGNVSAAGYITRTTVYDKTAGKALPKIKDASAYLKPDGSINHSAFYGYVGSEPGYNFTAAPILRSIPSTQCDAPDYSEEKTPATVCTTVWRTETTYPEIREDAVSLNREIDVLRQALYELKQCAADSKDWASYQKCVAS